MNTFDVTTVDEKIRGKAAEVARSRLVKAFSEFFHEFVPYHGNVTFPATAIKAIDGRTAEVRMDAMQGALRDASIDEYARRMGQEAVDAFIARFHQLSKEFSELRDDVGGVRDDIDRIQRDQR